MSTTTSSGLCLCGGPMGDHYPSAHPAPHVSPLCRCGHALSMHEVCGQYDGGCGVEGCRCAGFERAPVVDAAPLPTQLAQPTGRRESAIACIYIAGPYTAPDGRRVELNVREAEDVAYEVAGLGAMPVCPHTNLRYMSAPIAAFLYPATLELMRRCDAVLMLPWWRNSDGARGEYEEATSLRMPVFLSLAELRGWLSARSSRGGGA